jgi:hypothetical protein
MWIIPVMMESVLTRPSNTGDSIIPIDSELHGVSNHQYRASMTGHSIVLALWTPVIQGN